MPYEIHHRRWYNTHDDYALIACCSTLAEARDKRVVSGDLVVYADTHQIVRSTEWLWDWELSNPNCYAQMAIKSGSGA